MSFAAIYIPEFPVAAWQRISPELRAKRARCSKEFRHKRRSSRDARRHELPASSTA